MSRKKTDHSKWAKPRSFRSSEAWWNTLCVCSKLLGQDKSSLIREGTKRYLDILMEKRGGRGTTKPDDNSKP